MVAEGALVGSPFEIQPVKSDAQWEGFINHWAGGQDGESIKAIISVVRSRDCTAVVVERDYADLDQASEAEIWVREFAMPHSHVYRLHFFQNGLDGDAFPLGAHSGYLGYAVVVRPLGRLVRALVSPPPGVPFRAVRSSRNAGDLSHIQPVSGEGATTVVSEVVELFGHDLTVTGVPYCGRGAWHLDCGHAVAWTCLYLEHLHGFVPRATLRDVIDHSGNTRLAVLSSMTAGTTLFELQTILSAGGSPALVYRIDALISDPRLALGDVRRTSEQLSARRQTIYGVVCNYLNSGFPVIATTDEHAVLVIGWRRTEGVDGEIELLVSDDTPYESADAGDGSLETWKDLVVPLPPGIVMSGETAQSLAYEFISEPRDHLPSGVEAVPFPLELGLTQLQQKLGERQLSLRLQLKQRQDFKRALVSEQVDRGDRVRSALAAMQIPAWVWVVEVQERSLREAGEPCVVAEFVFDTTSPEKNPHRCAVSVGATTWIDWPYDARAATGWHPVTDESEDDGLPAWSSQINASASDSSSDEEES